MKYFCAILQASIIVISLLSLAAIAASTWGPALNPLPWWLGNGLAAFIIATATNTITVLQYECRQD